MFGGVLFGNYEFFFLTEFFFLSPFTCYLFLFVDTAKELRTERKEKEILLNLVLFSKFTTILWSECFPEPVEIAVFTSRDVGRISRIILKNCESLVSSIGGLRVHHVRLWSVGMFNWRCYELETSCAARSETLAYVCSYRLKKERLMSRDVSRGLRWNFFLVPGSPSFQSFADRSSWEIVFCIDLFYLLFILFCFYSFLLFSFLISYSIPEYSKHKATAEEEFFKTISFFLLHFVTSPDEGLRNRNLGKYVYWWNHLLKNLNFFISIHFHIRILNNFSLIFHER